jgi:hypothetical protein
MDVRAGEGGFRRPFPLEAFEEIRQRSVVRGEDVARGRCQDGVDEDKLGTLWLRHVEGIVGLSVDGHGPAGTAAMLKLMETACMHANSWPKATSG